MTLAQAVELKIGDRVYNGSLKGVVHDADERAVTLIWDDRGGLDAVQRTSPLLRFINTELGK